MLNSLYVLLRKDAELASQLPLKLSDFLRYLLLALRYHQRALLTTSLSHNLYIAQLTLPV